MFEIGREGVFHSDLSELLSLIIPSTSIWHWTEESQGRSLISKVLTVSLFPLLSPRQGLDN